MNLKLSKNQQEIGIVAIAISLLLIVITTLHLAIVSKVEAPSEPREKNKLKPTFYGVEELPKPNNYNKTKINIYKEKEVEVVKVEEKKEIASRGEEVYKSFGVTATAYTSKCKGCIGITKTGKDVRNTVHHKGHRIVAVDPNVIPLHSIVKVKVGDESFLAYALDTGGAIKGHKLDLLVETKSEAFEFGRQTVEVTIMREGKG
jgi:3D (Asp-Asp-Asp) domain-containing protein